VNNYFKPGPVTKSQKVWIVNPWQPYGKFFVEGNVVHDNEILSRENIKAIHADHPDSVFQASGFAVVPTSLQTASDAYEIVLLRSGASLHRDDVDRRVVEEVRSGRSIHGKNQNGIIDSQDDVGGWPVLKSAKALKDSDQDGMPDEWELSKQLNPRDANDAGKQTLQSGYDNIEVYLNSLIDVK
jgi:hypothetical protein